MSELIYCCPKCFAIDRTGIEVVSQRTIEQIHNRPALLICKHCKQLVSFPVKNTMVSDWLNSPGRFTSLSDNLTEASGRP